MHKRIPVAALAFALGASSGCDPAAVPGPADTAAYLGLADGATIAFVVGEGSGLGASLEVKQSSVLRDDALVFDLIGKEGGFVKDDRTFTLSVGLEDTKLVRFLDCVSRCAAPSTDIPFLAIPLKAGASSEATVDVVVDDGVVVSEPVAETHTLVVGEEGEITVPAGTFTGLTVSWSRVRDGVAQSSLLTIVPDFGIVAWRTFDGGELKRE